jgi:phage terminase large subunit-like protein
MIQATDYTARAIEYAQSVIAGRIVACKFVGQACERQLRDLEASAALADYPYWFDAEAAARPCVFIEGFQHVKGRFRGNIQLEDWQLFAVTTVFGWRRRDNGARRYRLVYIEVGRKNAKSTLASGLALYLLAADGEPGAIVVSAATTRDQAKLCFADAQQMARNTPRFRQAFGVRVLANAVVQDKSGSTFKPISKESKTQDGLNIHGSVVDELHAHPTRAIWDVLESATGSRTQSLLWAITTAGFNQSGICYEIRSYLTKVLDGTIDDDSMFGLIYTLDENDDPMNPDVWIKANPNLNVSVFADDIERQAKKAQQTPAALTNYLTKRMSCWVNADTAWIDPRDWQRAAAPGLSLDSFDYETPCYVGLDLATKDDLCAACFWFPADEYCARHRLCFRFWTSEGAIAKEENRKLKEFADAGLMIVHPGRIVDFESLADDLEAWARRLQIAELAVDPWQLPPLLAVLNRRSFEVPVIEERQVVATLSPAMKECSALLLDGQIEHDGNRAMQWQIGNVVCHFDAKENIYPRKAARPLKIDGAIAMFLACDRLLRVLGLPSGAYTKRQEILSVPMPMLGSAPAPARPAARDWLEGI